MVHEVIVSVVLDGNSVCSSCIDESDFEAMREEVEAELIHQCGLLYPDILFEVTTGYEEDILITGIQNQEQKIALKMAIESVLDEIY